MNLHICDNNTAFPFIYIDNLFNADEEILIWKELDFYTNPYALHRSEDDPHTSHKEGVPLSKAWRIFLDLTYYKRETSHILRILPQKLKSFEIKNITEEVGGALRMYAQTNYDITMINYYENSDYYESHRDHFMITSFCWFNREPKAYTGGNLILTDNETELECNHNRMVVFPSFYNHRISPVKMINANDTMNGFGRYAIINFSTYTGQN